MLDEQTRMMLEVANQLTSEDIELIKTTSPIVPNRSAVAEWKSSAETPTPPSPKAAFSKKRGEYERRRTRESKVSTGCVGNERKKHGWLPIGTQLVGNIDCERFTATVVENLSVKSGRSLLINSGPAQGKVCITPTRAALDATEQYRQIGNLGRSGGVTNGWTFWKVQS